MECYILDLTQFNSPHHAFIPTQIINNDILSIHNARGKTLSILTLGSCPVYSILVF